jgi:hypothetical protein
VTPTAIWSAAGPPTSAWETNTVRAEGLEPPRDCAHQDLNLKRTVARGVVRCQEALRCKDLRREGLPACYA